ncbi:MAG: hypothetical protein ACPGIA_07295, partial [Luteolibacter sp.]
GIHEFWGHGGVRATGVRISQLLLPTAAQQTYNYTAIQLIGRFRGLHVRLAIQGQCHGQFGSIFSR